MDENPAPLPGAEEPPTSSLAGRLCNVYVAPGEVFDEIKTRPAVTANWLVPLLLVVLVSWIASAVIFSQDFVKQQMTDMQEPAIRKQMEKAGKMTPQQIDQAVEQATNIAYLVIRIAAFVAPPFASAAWLFLGGLIAWLLGTKALKGQFGYMKSVEMMGLASMVGVLHVIVKTLVILVKGSILASPSLALLMKEINPMDPMFGLLASLDVFTFWSLALISLGLARLAGASFGRAAAWVFGIWLVFTAIMLGFGAVASRFAPQ